VFTIAITAITLAAMCTALRLLLERNRRSTAAMHARHDQENVEAWFALLDRFDNDSESAADRRA
jgi:hypothetical protein